MLFVPELARLPKDFIHKPWAAPEWVLRDAGIPVVVVPGMFALGYAMQRIVINRASHGKDENILLVTLGISIILENLALYAFKSDTRNIDTPYTLSTVDIAGALISVPKVVAFGGALARALTPAIGWATDRVRLRSAERS